MREKSAGRCNVCPNPRALPVRRTREQQAPRSARPTHSGGFGRRADPRARQMRRAACAGSVTPQGGVPTRATRRRTGMPRSCRAWTGARTRSRLRARRGRARGARWEQNRELRLVGLLRVAHTCQLLCLSCQLIRRSSHLCLRLLQLQCRLRLRLLCGGGLGLQVRKVLGLCGAELLQAATRGRLRAQRAACASATVRREARSGRSETGGTSSRPGPGQPRTGTASAKSTAAATLPAIATQILRRRG